MGLLRFVLVLLLLPAICSCLPCHRYDSIFSFGDSFVDTGNDVVVLAAHSLRNPTTRPPYGMTFFGHPTGRFCNGRLIIDFIAEKLGLPFVPPFLAHNGSFRQGANFAVAGATALNASFFNGVIPGVKSILNISSSVQLSWFDSLKPSLCSSAAAGGCKDFFRKSLFFMGEFGVNDYNLAVFGKTLPEVRSFVPDVVKTISSATERLIEHDGVKAVVVPGIPPLGCMPSNLAMFPSTNPAGYELGTGCLRQFNEIAVYHNTLLQDALKNIKKNHPDVQIIYADFFTPVIRIVKSPGSFGFTSDILRCCCGGGGKYNFNMSAGCGMADATVCKDPSTHLFWDGHMTEAAYRFIANGWLDNITKS